MDVKDWKLVEGRYEIGDVNSPVAVCTNTSIDTIKLDMGRVAIAGKAVTENIGIEKIILNIISNPDIRFLILCGKQAKGHFVSQCIIALIKNGVDKDKRIIGADGNMPYLKNLSNEQIQRFRNQIQPIDMIGEIDSKKIMKMVEECLKKSPCDFDDEPVENANTNKVDAEPFNDFIADPKGYFLININKKDKKIIVEHYKDDKSSIIITGNNGDEIRDTIARLKLIPDFDRTLQHSIYIGKELYKAELALKLGLDYEQDSELDIKTSNKKNKSKEREDEYGWFD